MQCISKTGRFVWYGSEGGLVRFDLNTHQFQTWTNTEGLAYNEVTAIAANDSGQIWIGMKNGMLQYLDPDRESWQTVDDYQGQSVTTLTIHGDSLFIGLDIGLSLFILSRNEVKETYKHLGAALEVEIPVNDILIKDGILWVATSQGIAFSSLDFINLLDPSNWQNVTVADGLPATAVSALESGNGEILAGTDAGIARYNGAIWEDVSGVLAGVEIRDIVFNEGTTLVLTSGGIYEWIEGEWTLQSGSASLSGGTCLLIDAADWIAGSENGLLIRSGASENWALLSPNGPRGSMFSDLAVDREGVLYCCSARDGGQGFYSFDGTVWRNFNRAAVPVLPTDAFYRVAVDRQNNKWFGTWGGGVVVLASDSTYRFYNAKNDYLEGIPADPDFSVITGLAADSSETMWILDWDPYHRLPLASVTRDSVWTYYGSQSGISTVYVTALLVDNQGRKWIGTQQNGVLVFDDNGTPALKQDDEFLGTLTTADGLETNEITSLVQDLNGSIWIGTPRGLYSYTNGDLRQIYRTPSDIIRDMALDGVNNLWVATSSGAGRFAIQKETWEYFNEDNSPIIDNDVISVTVNRSNGVLYFGTNRGLSVFQTVYSEPLAELSQLRIYPNPYHPGNHEFLTIDRLTFNVTVNIFSSDGRLVRSFPQSEVAGKSVQWKGMDDRGNNVPGGIYIVTTTTEDGNTMLGKVAVVR